MQVFLRVQEVIRWMSGKLTVLEEKGQKYRKGIEAVREVLLS